MSEKPSASARMVLLVTTLGAFMSTFAASSVNVALPPLAADLGLSGVGLSWVTTAFLLGSGVFLLAMGRLGDIFGRKRLFALGLVIYTLGSVLSALAPSGSLLIILRALAGIGASMINPTASALLVGVHSPQERGRVIGINVAAVYLGLSVGPVVGGLITSALGWRGLFLIHGLTSAITLVLVLALLKGEWRIAKGEKVDWAGTVIYAMALSALLIGFSSLPALHGFLLLGTGLFALGGFVLWELRCHHPLLQVRIFRGNRVFTLSNLAAMISYSATFSVAFFLSLYLEVVRGMPPQAAGLILVIQPVIQAVFSPLTGRLSDRVQPRFLASAGMLLTAAGMVVLAFLGADTPLALILVALVCLGLGFALFSSPNTNAVMGAVEHKHLGIASATIATMRVVGMAASMGIALVLFTAFIGQAAVTPATAGGFLGAQHAAYVISAVLCALGVFASLARGKQQFAL